MSGKWNFLPLETKLRYEREGTIKTGTIKVWLQDDKNNVIAYSVKVDNPPPEFDTVDCDEKFEVLE